jgi:ubiquitin carboxyl-terminal hydrolase 7
LNGDVKVKVVLKFPSNEGYPDSLVEIDDDAKRVTGLVGLKNQGATCYMNSLLQMLYHLGSFSKAIFKIPTEQEKSESDRDSIALALQRVFYDLHFSTNAVSTKRLTNSFGWSSVDAFMQHDVQEFARVLTDAVEKKMKNTPAADTMNLLFRGRSMAYIQCTNVQYSSTRTEDFFDLSLNVKGCKTLLESFRKYTEEEMLDGDNQYRAGDFGLQDAKKGIRFVELPPILQIQLKRFEYDYVRNTMVKVNDYFEFPSELDLNSFIQPNSEDPASEVKSTDYDKVDNSYILHSVLVHSGSVYGGHYYVFIRQSGEKNGQWFKFDDENVTKVDNDSAIAGNYGTDLSSGNYGISRMRSANAYMLVYVRQSHVNELLGRLEDDDIPEYLKERFKREADEESLRLQREEEEARMMDLNFLFEEDLVGFRGLELNQQKWNLRTLKVYKDEEMGSIRSRIELEFSLNPGDYDLYCFCFHDNRTYRPNNSVDLSKNASFFTEKKQPILIRRKSYRDSVSSGIFILFKLFDPENETLEFVGSGVFSAYATLEDISSFIIESRNYLSDTKFLFLEECSVSERDIKHLDDYEKPLKDFLVNGDIVVFQVVNSYSSGVSSEEEFKVAKGYLLNLYDCITVRYGPLPRRAPTDEMKANEGIYLINLRRSDGYEQVARAIAAQLRSPQCIPFLQLYIATSNEDYQKWNFNSRQVLQTFMKKSADDDVCILYEMSRYPLRVMGAYYEYSIWFFESPALDLYPFHFIYPREEDCSVRNVLSLFTRLYFRTNRSDIQSQANEFGQKIRRRPLRLITVHESRIVSILKDSDIMRWSIASQSPLCRIEFVSDDEMLASEGDRVFWVVFFSRQTMTYYGNPFSCVLKRVSLLSLIMCV